MSRKILKSCGSFLEFGAEKRPLSGKTWKRRGACTLEVHARDRRRGRKRGATETRRYGGAGRATEQHLQPAVSAHPHSGWLLARRASRAVQGHDPKTRTAPLERGALPGKEGRQIVGPRRGPMSFMPRRCCQRSCRADGRASSSCSAAWKPLACCQTPASPGCPGSLRRGSPSR